MLVNFKVALAVSGERQIDLAQRCGIDPTLLSFIINQRREASPELRLKLATALGVSDRWLFRKGRTVCAGASARHRRESREPISASGAICVGAS
jgi:transcriptional regulator with XRE-family HTH domain